MAKSFGKVVLNCQTDIYFINQCLKYKNSTQFLNVEGEIFWDVWGKRKTVLSIGQLARSQNYTPELEPLLSFTPTWLIWT